MFAASSKRARSSMSTVTSLPAFAAGHETLRERRVRRRPVERLLDREHVGIVRGAVDEVDDRCKRLERVVQ